jgi:hypothetical protein
MVSTLSTIIRCFFSFAFNFNLRRFNKAAQFIEIMRGVIGRSFGREYLLVHPNVQEVPSTAADLEPFYEWLRGNVHDEAFTLIAEVMVGLARFTVFCSELTKGGRAKAWFLLPPSLSPPPFPPSFPPLPFPPLPPPPFPPSFPPPCPCHSR